MCTLAAESLRSSAHFQCGGGTCTRARLEQQASRIHSITVSVPNTTSSPPNLCLSRHSAEATTRTMPPSRCTQSFLESQSGEHIPPRFSPSMSCTLCVWSAVWEPLALARGDVPRKVARLVFNPSPPDRESGRARTIGAKTRSDQMRRHRPSSRTESELRARLAPALLAQPFSNRRAPRRSGEA